MNIAAQLFGLGAMISLFLTYLQESHSKIIMGKLCSDVFWIFHYFFLGAYAGMIPGSVGIFRELAFFQRGKKKWAGNAALPIIFVIVSIAVGVFTFDGAADLLPMGASVTATIALWLNNPIIMKRLTIPASAMMLAYDAFVGSYIGIATEVFTLASIALYFIRAKKQNQP